MNLPELFESSVKRLGERRVMVFEGRDYTNIELLDSKRLQVSVTAATGTTLRPAQFLGLVFHLGDDQVKQARVVKLKREMPGV